jgi:LuxR family maltose regulon positive regulatory protein
MMNARGLCLLKMHRYREVEELEAATRALASGVSNYGAVYAECIFGLGELAQGRLHSATAIFTAALSLATTQSTANSAPAAMASACLAAALYESGQLDAAGALLDRYLTTITHMGIPDMLLMAHMIHARIAYSNSGYAEACRLLNELKQIGYERDLPRVIGAAWAEQARLALLQDDALSAARYLQMAETGAPYATLWDESDVTLRARLLAAQNKPREGVTLLDGECRAAETLGRRRHALKLGVLLALTQKHARQATEAMHTLAGCVEAGAREGFVRVFVDEGRALVLLLRELRATRDVPESSAGFIDRLLGEMDAVSPTASAPADDEPRLSRREFEILALLAEGLSNQAITQKLSLSLPTVKSHVRNTMGKLGAANRSEAVAIARRQKLL